MFGDKGKRASSGGGYVRIPPGEPRPGGHGPAARAGGRAGGGAGATAARAALATVIICLSLSFVIPSLPVVRRAFAGTLSGWKFCVDPGHGGSETGAVGPTGLMEKDVNLRVALYLKDLLEAEGAEVLMTRYDDAAVSITQRWQMANAWGAHRFISIHHNAESDRAINYTVTLVSVNASQESMELANAVQAELVGEFGLGNSGVWKVNYCGVLNNTVMPAILTEASFISNPEQEQRLRDESYLQREAAAILRGIHMPSSISFALPQANRVSEGVVDVEVQLLGEDALERLDLELDGKPLASRSSKPYRFQVDSSALGDGTYSLRAVAHYGNGSTASAARDLIVANAARHWYFAEGTTREGFEEWLTVLNPNPEPVTFKVTYAFGGDGATERSYQVAEESRLSIEVAGEVGKGRDVSVIVDSPLPLMVERPMYFLYQGRWAGGHVSAGTNAPSTEWYFAEGYTGEGFEEWLCLLNPGDERAEVTIEYVSQGGLLKQERRTLHPKQRDTVFVNQAAGPGREVSLRVISDKAVVAERPMYFLYHGLWAGGHVSAGTNAPSTEWYFAEGYTGEGFEEWLCLYNPNPEPNLVSISYQTQDGAVIGDQELVPPYSRRTVDVNLRAGRNLQLSIAAKGERPLVAERAIYHDYHDWCEGGDVGKGVTAPSRHWYFAEGCTGDGFEEWLCMQNPGESPVEAEIRLHHESGEVLAENITLQPHGRTTVFINSMSPYQEGVALSVHADGDIVAERPLYFRYRGAWAGGHVSAGFYPGMGFR
ncbi:MAG: hypothetical protein HPY75_00645 [Actinobacteria bacterium]|nr:hypothetical protein [Actinomycetota bacterium]